MWSWTPSLWKFPNKALSHTLTIPRTCVWRCAKSCPAMGGACDDGRQSPGDNLDPQFWSVFLINSPHIFHLTVQRLLNQVPINNIIITFGGFENL